MTTFGNLYNAYKALRTFDGQLEVNRVSNDPELIEDYRLSLAKYREIALSSLSSILRQLNDRFMEEYANQERFHNR